MHSLSHEMQPEPKLEQGDLAQEDEGHCGITKFAPSSHAPSLESL